MGEELTTAKQKLYLDCMFHSACNDLNRLLVKDTSSLGVLGVDVEILFLLQVPGESCIISFINKM